MPLTFVTALYDVRANYKVSLLQQFHQLVTLLPAGSQLIVWTDFDDVEMNPNTHVHDHVCICKAPLSSFTTYEAIMKRPLALPVQRNAAKDTQAFMALMNTKVEMLWRAMPFVGTDGVAWIDAGICKIFRAEEMEVVKGDLAAAAGLQLPRHRVVVPGCWPRNTVDRQRVCWRFCGGYVVLHRDVVDRFYEACWRWLTTRWFPDGYVGWEVNLWAELEGADGDLFAWYTGDHNRSMMQVRVSS